jgi:nucleotide-binding universal stress UspA family protein/CBS domain-containing protein
MDLATLMRRPVVTIAADASLSQAHVVMRRWGIRHLPVLDAGRLVGLLTDRQACHAAPSRLPASTAAAQPAWRAALPVRQVMTQRFVQRPPQTRMQEVAWLLWAGQADSILVVEQSRLVGIVTTSDLLHALPELVAQPWPGTYRQMVVPVGLGPAAAPALQTALRLARQHQARLTLLHVLVPLARARGPAVDQVPGSRRARKASARTPELRQWLATLVEADDAVHVTYHITAGALVPAIVHTATAVKADLIVMGRRERRGVPRWLARHVTEEVVRHAPCPVLIVRTPRRTHDARA